MSYLKLRYNFHNYSKPYQLGGNLTNLSDTLVIFDIDGVLLRYDSNIKFEFSPILKDVFTILTQNNCKIAIATHGGSIVFLKQQMSPVNHHINSIHPKYIKQISEPQYELSQFKFTMLNDLIKEAIKDFNIKHVIFFDDDPQNLNSLIKLRQYYPKLTLHPIRVHSNLLDIYNNYNYPLLRQISQRNPNDSIKNQFLSLIN